MPNGRNTQYEYREPPGTSWSSSRMWVVSEINRNAKEIREIEEIARTSQVDIAVLQARSAMLGFIGGLIGSGAITLIIRLLVK